MKIGTTIKQLRKKKYYTQQEFAEIIGIAQTSLSQIEGDLKYPKSKTMNKIAKALDMPESLIYMLSMNETHVHKSKRKLFNEIYPTIKKMIDTLI